MKVVGGVAHRGDDDDDLVPGADAPDDTAGDVADAVGVGDGCAAVLLDYEHDPRMPQRRRTNYTAGRRSRPRGTPTAGPRRGAGRLTCMSAERYFVRNCVVNIDL